MPLAVRITRITEDVGLSENRSVIPQVRVDFMVGDHGPFSERFPKDGFDSDAARRKLDTFAASLERMTR